VSADWDLIPEYMHPALRRYIELGIAPGDFLRSVLCNDLRSAVWYADHTNLRYLPSYVNFLSDAPAECWGSHKKYLDWIHQGGLSGREKKWEAA